MQPKKKATAYTPLRDANHEVENKRVFRGNSIFSRWIWDTDPDDPMHIKPSRYAVYSYGEHFPMYVWDENTQQWYGNSSRYSVTTTKHQGKCCPRNVSHWFPTERIKHIVIYGAVGSTIRIAQNATLWELS